VIDEVAKKLTFSDNRPLTVTRLDKYWINANRDGIFYEFASSTTQDSVTTTIVGSGQCVISPALGLLRAIGLPAAYLQLKRCPEAQRLRKRGPYKKRLAA
jgi:hypothetical protein